MEAKLKKKSESVEECVLLSPKTHVATRKFAMNKRMLGCNRQTGDSYTTCADRLHAIAQEQLNCLLYTSTEHGKRKAALVLLQDVNLSDFAYNNLPIILVAKSVNSSVNASFSMTIDCKDMATFARAGIAY